MKMDKNIGKKLMYIKMLQLLLYILWPRARNNISTLLTENVLPMAKKAACSWLPEIPYDCKCCNKSLLTRNIRMYNTRRLFSNKAYMGVGTLFPGGAIVNFSRELP